MKKKFNMFLLGAGVVVGTSLVVYAAFYMTVLPH